MVRYGRLGAITAVCCAIELYSSSEVVSLGHQLSQVHLHYTSHDNNRARKGPDATSSHEHAHSSTYLQQRRMGASVAIGDGKTAFNVASGRHWSSIGPTNAFISIISDILTEQASQTRCSCVLRIELRFGAWRWLIVHSVAVIA